MSRILSAHKRPISQSTHKDPTVEVAATAAPSAVAMDSPVVPPVALAKS